LSVRCAADGLDLQRSPMICSTVIEPVIERVTDEDSTGEHRHLVLF
jgi:hypothetical protein